MKPVLMENAFEAWAAAIRFCDDIKDGKATLQYQKDFVLSLHNAVELIMKQMLLNNNDHRVAEVRKAKNEADAKLLFDYFKATDLNSFFDTLSNEDLSKFNTIQFNELIYESRNCPTRYRCTGSTELLHHAFGSVGGSCTKQNPTLIFQSRLHRTSEISESHAPADF